MSDYFNIPLLCFVRIGLPVFTLASKISRSFRRDWTDLLYFLFASLPTQAPILSEMPGITMALDLNR